MTSRRKADRRLAGGCLLEEVASAGFDRGGGLVEMGSECAEVCGDHSFNNFLTSSITTSPLLRYSVAATSTLPVPPSFPGSLASIHSPVSAALTTPS